MLKTFSMEMCHDIKQHDYDTAFTLYSFCTHYTNIAILGNKACAIIIVAQLIDY